MFYAPLAGVIALLFALYLANKVNKEEQGTPKMIEISRAIQQGAMTFWLENIGSWEFLCW